MNLAAGVALVAVKRKAMNRSTKVRTSLYMEVLTFLTLDPRIKKLTTYLSYRIGNRIHEPIEHIATRELF
jgi:hypothetical protein